MPRPRVSPGEDTVTISARAAARLRVALKQAAAEAGRSYSDEVRLALQFWDDCAPERYAERVAAVIEASLQQHEPLVLMDWEEFNDVIRFAMRLGLEQLEREAGLQVRDP